MSDWIEPEYADDWKSLHYCELPYRPHLHGAAIDDCSQDKNGRLFASNGEYGSQVNFCPMCGYEAPTKIGE